MQIKLTRYLPLCSEHIISIIKITSKIQKIFRYLHILGKYPNLSWVKTRNIFTRYFRTTASNAAEIPTFSPPPFGIYIPRSIAISQKMKLIVSAAENAYTSEPRRISVVLRFGLRADCPINCLCVNWIWASSRNPV